MKLTDSEIDQMHDLEHAAMERAGIPALVNEATPLLTLVLMLIKESGFSHAQSYGVMSALPELLKGTMCDKCIDLGDRIKASFVEDFSKYVQARKEKESN